MGEWRGWAQDRDTAMMKENDNEEAGNNGREMTRTRTMVTARVVAKTLTAQR